jgi:hypothetical protein
VPNTYEEARRKAEELERAVRSALPKDRWQLVHTLREADGDAQYIGQQEYVSHLVGGIARHFPGLEPAIRAVAAHFTETAQDHTDPAEDGCGLSRRPIPDYLLGGCAPDTGEADAEEAKAS